MIKHIQCTKTHNGPLAKGCKMCITGHKSVIFITGKCHYQCFYCPISDDKRNKDIVKVNEKIITLPDSEEGFLEIVKEIRACQSTGVSLTGGDPLAKLQRSCQYIKRLKNIFGEQFHIHLYTSPHFVSQDAIVQLEQAGLDEIRFHLQLDNPDSWLKIMFVEGHAFDVGVEIPAIPGREEKTKELLFFCKQSGVIDFVNINELEYSDTSENSLTNHEFVVKDNLSYGIAQSEELAKKLVEYGKKINLRVHYCSAQFKDKVQLGNRFLLRAKKTAQEYDLVDDEGILTRGEIVCKDKSLDLEDLRLELIEAFEIPQELLEYQQEKSRLLIASWVLEEIISQMREKHEEDNSQYSWLDSLECSIIKEYPTSDAMLIEKTIL
ncbi:MAG: radical SAM protein [Candidatus Nanoarchaeia archaeon]